MYTYGLTRKQCGVIFSNWKRGNIEATKEMISWMYDTVQDRSVLANSAEAEFFTTMRYCLDHIFAGEYEEATASFNNAYIRYNAKFQAC